MRKNCAIIVEDDKRNLILCNSTFCDLFGIPISPEKMIGSDCSKSADFVKHLFLYPDKFVDDIYIILENKKTIINEKIIMKDGRVLFRDYIPIFLVINIWVILGNII
jgi:PAS domain-containing protein